MMTNVPTPADLARLTAARVFTQEELDSRIADALRKQREQYADYEVLRARAADSDRLERELEETRGAAAEAERETLLDRLQRKYEFDDEDVRLFLRSHEGDNDSLVDRAERIAAVLKRAPSQENKGPLFGPGPSSGIDHTRKASQHVQFEAQDDLDEPTE